MTKEDSITISLKRYLDLMAKEDILEALKIFGVENWEGYDEAMRSLEDEDNDEEEEEEEE
jgi:hypothetical protein